MTAVFSGFKDSLTASNKKLRQKITSLDYKYENLYLWSQMINQMLNKMKDQMITANADNRRNIEGMAECVSL